MIETPTTDASELVLEPDQVTGGALTPEQRQDRAAVKTWLDRIARAKRHWEPDFERMRKNMEFASGIQWPGQTTVDTDRYVVFLTLRLINQKVASLYAKNPKVVAQRRKRRDFAVWDESIETLLRASEQAAMILGAGMPLPPELSMLFMDIERGRAAQQNTEALGATLEILFDYTIDAQKPEFKQQLKQAIVRACVCGVAFARPIWCTEDDNRPTSEGPGGSLAGRAQALLEKVDEDEGVAEDDARYSTLRSFAYALGASPEVGVMPERLEFDFPPTTSIIVDTRCRNLVDFVAARWIAQEYILPIEEVNAVFGTEVKIGDKGADEYNERNDTDLDIDMGDREAQDLAKQKMVCVYEVWDYTTRTRFFVCKGWPDYLMSPEPPTPAVTGFWQHFALTLNAIETEPGCKASIYPPSDVQTVKSAQLEWNRTRDALRDQRNANAPKYLVRKGLLTDNDKRNLTNALPNTVVELEGVPPEMPLDKVVMPFQFAAIDTNLYDASPLEQDILMGGGMQQANLGPAQSNVTATVGSIAEQSRLNVSASNVDDLDGFLSRIAQASGEILVQAMSPQVVEMIVGPGAVWPTTPEDRFKVLNEISLKVEAASSGRPNKAIDVANWRDLAPLLLQSGANPIGVIHETARRIDDNLDVTKFFPILPPAAPATGSKETTDTSTGSASTAAPTGGTVPPSPASVASGGPGDQTESLAPVSFSQ